MSAVSVIARLRIKKGRMNEAVETIRRLIEKVAAEEGVLHYSLSRDNRAPDALVIIERYKSRAAMKNHGAQPHVKAFFVKAGDFLDGPPEVFVLEEIASK